MFGPLWLWAVLKGAALVHALRAGTQPFWWFIIICVPLGEIGYAMYHLLPGRSRAKMIVAQADTRPVDTVRYEYERTPSLNNLVLLAGRLYDEDEYEEAAGLYEKAVERDDQLVRGWYGLGITQLARGDFEAAVVSLRTTVELSRGYAEYGAWLRLVDALRKIDQRALALEELQKLVAASPRLVHVVELGSELVDAGRLDEAKSLLTSAVQDYEHAPRHIRKKAKGEARRATELLGDLA